ncbi:MAG: T9SS type A sorting domain-containing protein, partial [Ignavibacteriales bacterium]|nr:T9SS type A sorting domain-containing protein [Ignavibacteriales bacterium]
TYPNGGETLAAGSSEVIRWSERFVSLVKLEYSTDNGAGWNLIADNLPATPNSYSWTVPKVSTSQARIRITDVVNGQPADTSDGAFSIIINPDVVDGWNLVSLPFRVPDPRRTVVFPTAVSEAFAFDAGYVKRDTLLHGAGYWLKFNSAQYLPLSGDSIVTDTVDVKAGWNLIGSVSKNLLVSTITEIPNGIVTSQYFGYQVGYFMTDTIQPKHAYWVKVNANGKLVLSSSPTSNTNKEVAGDPLSLLNSLTIKDHVGRSQTLYFENDRNDLLLINRYEMPPPVPEVGFDARFATGRMVEILADHHEGVSVRVSSTAYPLTITWKAQSSPLQKAILTIDKHPFPLIGSGETQIENPNPQIRLVQQDYTDGQMPSTFTLFQNFPNPFNPTTKITYGLPERSKVVLKIYDVVGQELATLVDEVQDAGLKSITWEPAREPSGIYFYKLTAGRFTDTKKMLLIR